VQGQLPQPDLYCEVLRTQVSAGFKTLQSFEHKHLTIVQAYCVKSILMTYFLPITLLVSTSRVQNRTFSFSTNGQWKNLPCNECFRIFSWYCKVQLSGVNKKVLKKLTQRSLFIHSSRNGFNLKCLVGCSSSIF